MEDNLIVPVGWSLQGVKRHHDLVYWSMWALHLLSSLMPGVSPTPPVADVSYTLRRSADGKVATIRLDGDHAPDTLSKTVQLIEARPVNQELKAWGR
jgi:hypothetical protein